MPAPALTTELNRLPVPVIVARILRGEVARILRQLGRALGASRAPEALTLEQLAVPDSALAEKATALARQIEPDFVFNHSVRTYLYGVAVGHHLGLKPDRELVYLASILHDMGLMSEHDHGHSFELDSARLAHDLLLEHGVDPQRAALVHEAIALHTSAGIAGSREPEIALTHFGAGLDVIGLRYDDVADETHASILKAWPRERFKDGFVPLLLEQAERKPDCHIAGFMGIGFGKKIAKAPFAE